MTMVRMQEYHLYQAVWAQHSSLVTIHRDIVYSQSPSPEISQVEETILLEL